MKPIAFNFTAPYRASFSDGNAPPAVRVEQHDAATLEAAREWLRERLESDALELRGQGRNGEAGMLLDWIADEFASGALYEALAQPVSIPEHGYCLCIEARQVLPHDIPRATAELALLFRAEVRNALSPAQLAQVDHINATDPGGACASHNFMDSNVCMINAFNALLSRDPEGCLQHDADLCNAAWDAVVSFGYSDSGPTL